VVPWAGTVPACQDENRLSERTVVTLAGNGTAPVPRASARVLRLKIALQPPF
jgi:hypothetical protein